MNFTRPVFLVRANLVFAGIRYKHLEYKASKLSPFYTTESNSLRAAHPAAGTECWHWAWQLISYRPFRAFRSLLHERTV